MKLESFNRNTLRFEELSHGYWKAELPLTMGWSQVFKSKRTINHARALSRKANKMRVAIAGILTLNLLLSLACTSVKVETEYAEDAGTHLTRSGVRMPISPIDLADLPKSDLSSLMLSKSGVRGNTGAPLCPADPIRARARATAQDTDVWCWAASTQMVMEAHGTQIQQCEIANKVQNRGRTPVVGGAFCCGDVNAPTFPDGSPYPLLCRRNGWPHKAFDRLNFHWKWFPEALPKQVLNGQLCETGPFIYVILFKGGGGHSLVVTDTAEIDGEQVLYVHDHRWTNNTFPRVATAIYEMSYKDFVDGVWGTSTHTHDFDYVQIKPK